MKIMVEGYEVEVHDKIVEKFKKDLTVPFVDEIRHFLWSDFEEENLNLIFKNHPPEEITKTLNQCMIDEIHLHGDKRIFSYLDSIGYTEYNKPDWI